MFNITLHSTLRTISRQTFSYCDNTNPNKKKGEILFLANQNLVKKKDTKYYQHQHQQRRRIQEKGLHVVLAKENEKIHQFHSHTQTKRNFPVFSSFGGFCMCVNTYDKQLGVQRKEEKVFYSCAGEVIEL